MCLAPSEHGCWGFHVERVAGGHWQGASSSHGNEGRGLRASPHFWAVFLFVLSANGYFPTISSSAPWQSGGGGTGRVGTETDHLSCLLLSPLTPPVGRRRFGSRSLIAGTPHVHLHVPPAPVKTTNSWIFRAALFNAHNSKRTTAKSFRGNMRKGE